MSQRIPQKPKRRPADFRSDPCGDVFTCRSCGWPVGPADAGTRHRNHCPNCCLLYTSLLLLKFQNKSQACQQKNDTDREQKPGGAAIYGHAGYNKQHAQQYKQRPHQSK